MTGVVVLPLASTEKKNTKQKQPLRSCSGCAIPIKWITDAEQQGPQVNVSANILLLHIKTSDWRHF